MTEEPFPVCPSCRTRMDCDVMLNRWHCTNDDCGGECVLISVPCRPPCMFMSRNGECLVKL